MDSMNLDLPSVNESDDFPIPPLQRHSEPGYVLGELRLEEVAEPEDDIKETTSSKRHAYRYLSEYSLRRSHRSDSRQRRLRRMIAPLRSDF